ncbi:glycerophosphodiester phosphodiesterase family protein [Candidatus Halocynthiibacter alkanivorans]|jgi:glycerophosphoryl diester phosphodiesterase|uniref:glycerophosphodiester phosphodiesterase family protein n=1 Tax=Candidatus Halocynthiibacter alkanivorans TaxID=2267619 RepID=UPI000DF21E1A|nr:glycerophosphodiester phosphodiesterase family protein [Candidatus Halocynthiibacter alkanivorans]
MTRLPDAFLKAPIAHRGLHDVSSGRPENSPAAFLAAIEAGVGIELDLQLSKDGEAMVFHDYDLGRVTGETGPVRQRTAAELGAIALTGGSDTIPTLKQVLALVDGRVALLIELKDQDGAMGPETGPLEAATARALQGYNGPVALMSFNAWSVAEAARVMPELPRGLVTAPFDPEEMSLVPEARRETLRKIADYDRVGACFISHSHTDLASERVAELKSLGADILCWTIRSQEQEDEARKVAANVTFEGYTPSRA